MLCATRAPVSVPLEPLCLPTAGLFDSTTRCSGNSPGRPETLNSASHGTVANALFRSIACTRWITIRGSVGELAVELLGEPISGVDPAESVSIPEGDLLSVYHEIYDRNRWKRPASSLIIPSPASPVLSRISSKWSTNTSYASSS